MACRGGGLSSNDRYDLQTVEVMQRVLTTGSNCVDVGCHQGCILRDMLRFAPLGTHYAFEPIPSMCQSLRKTFGGRRGVHIHEVALGDTDGETRFNIVTTNPGFSGMRRRDYPREDETVVEIPVQVRRLDGLWPRELPLHFLKIDVEGAELLVLKGACETIRRDRPCVVFEHGLGAADVYGTAPEQVHDLLTGCGLQVFLMEEWLQARSPLSREAFGDEFRTGRNYYFMACRRA